MRAVTLRSFQSNCVDFRNELSQESEVTEAEVDALGVSTDIQSACKAIGISKSAGYQAAKNGTFPCPVVRVGSRYVVPTAGLKAVLGLATTSAA